MIKPGYVSLDKTGVNKESMAKDSMPGFEDFDSYINQAETTGGEYRQDEPAPEQQQNDPNVRAARPGDSISVPDRYY